MTEMNYDNDDDYYYYYDVVCVEDMACVWAG